MELGLIEIIGMMLGSGAATGGVTLAGMRVHIQYLREQDKRHQAEIEAGNVRVAALEKETIILRGMTERAHNRIDDLKGVHL